MKKFFLICFFYFVNSFSIHAQETPHVSINLKNDITVQIDKTTFDKLTKISGTIKNTIEDLGILPEGEEFPLQFVPNDDFVIITEKKNDISIIDLMYNIYTKTNEYHNFNLLKERIEQLAHSENGKLKLIRLIETANYRYSRIIERI